jgi:hypothetical protein
VTAKKQKMYGGEVRQTSQNSQPFPLVFRQKRDPLAGFWMSQFVVRSVL